MRSLWCCVLLTMCLGCGGISVTPTPEAVTISGEVTQDSKPVNDVKLNLQVTGDGLPAVIDVVDGKFTAEVVPGKYTFFITPGKSANSFKAIPEEYRAGSLDREYEVSEGTELILALD